MPDAAVDQDITRGWLSFLYGNVEEGWLTLFSLDRTTGERHTDWFGVDDLDAAAARAIERSASCCVWFGVATRAERLVGKRGGAEHCAQVPALWVDIDVAGDVHAAEGLPATYGEATGIIERFPIPPTAVIHSGHGLQAWWMLTEAADATDVARVLPRWNATWQALAAPWHIDNVFDLPRIMRLPGTLNRKTDPEPVEIIEADWDHLVELSDLDEQLQDPPPAPTQKPATRRLSGSEGLPGQVFNDTHTGAEILTRIGFEHDHTDTQGDHYRRPGKAKSQGASATVYSDDGHTTIWSDTVTAQYPALEVRRPYDPFGLYACLEHGGDHRAAAAELERQGFGTLAPTDLPPDSELFAPDLLGAPASEPTQPDTLHVRWVDDYPANPPPEPDPIIDGLLNAGEFMVIGAERGIGKTWLGYNIASLLTTAAGPLFGRLPIPQARNVLYLQGELDETQAWARWQMLHQPPDPMTAPVYPHIAESFERVSLRAVERRATTRIHDEVFSDTYVDAVIDGRLEHTIAQMGTEVVIIDPWAVYFGGNENSNDQVEAVLSELRRIGMRQRVAWIILHHFGKSREQAEAEDLWRGASRLADWAANRVTIARHYSDRQAASRDLARAEARRFADLHFLRRGAPLDGFSIHLEASGWWTEWVPDDGPGAPLVRGELTRDDVLDALASEGEFSSIRHASDTLGVAQHTAKRVLSGLVADGWIDAERTIKGAFTYRLTEEARE